MRWLWFHSVKLPDKRVTHGLSVSLDTDGNSPAFVLGLRRLSITTVSVAPTLFYGRTRRPEATSPRPRRGALGAGAGAASTQELTFWAGARCVGCCVPWASPAQARGPGFHCWGEATAPVGTEGA